MCRDPATKMGPAHGILPSPCRNLDRERPERPPIKTARHPATFERRIPPEYIARPRFMEASMRQVKTDSRRVALVAGLLLNGLLFGAACSSGTEQAPAAPGVTVYEG